MVGAYRNELERSRKRLALLNKYYIPTRCANGLQGGISAKAFDKDDGKKTPMTASETVQLAEQWMIMVALCEY